MASQIVSSKTPGSCLTSDSLFSLELVVDKLILKSTTCRFPAIAFRLLDFPTLIIYHVEPELGETIKAKLTTDPHYKVPPQLTELKDKDGFFPVKKGKSCLLRVSPNDFLSHLQTTPLYVMVIDSFPGVPKLVGSCIVPVADVMDSVYDDICRLGISTPSTHGGKGVYNVYSLMGEEIGKIFLGYRILSLGVSLMSHIPDHAIMKRGLQQTKQPPENVVPDDKGAHGETKHKQEDVIVIQDLEAIDQMTQVALPVAKSIGVTQTEEAVPNLRDISPRKRAKDAKIKLKQPVNIQAQLCEEGDNVFVSNIVCPPPLYFNSEGTEPVPNILKSGAPELVESEDESEDNTIRHEDKFSDSDDQLDVKEFEPVLKDAKTAVKSWINNEKPKQIASKGDIVNLPVLNALLKEIATLQGLSVSDTQMAEKKVQVTDTPRLTSRSRTESPGCATAHPESKEEFLSRLSSPKHGRPDVKKGKEQATVDKSMKNKGWIRQQEMYGVKKTKLTSGMTNTQRLRLAKTNPGLLRTLEKDEQERMERIRANNLQKYPWLKQQQIIGVPHPEPSDVQVPDGDRITKLQLALEESNGTVPRHRKPVPTPRLSITGEKDKPFLTPRISKSHGLVQEKTDAAIVDNSSEIKKKKVPTATLR